MAKAIKVKCSKCKGTGLYARPTSYTVKGKPICFQCQGAGEIDYNGPLSSRLYKAKIGNKTILVSASKKKFYAGTSKQEFDELELPF